jgi:hypothetical protein
MPRVIVFNALFFLLPFGIYAAYLFATRGTVGRAGDWPVRTIAYLAMGGATLMVVAILAFIHFDTGPTNECEEAVAAAGLPPDTPCRSVYVPARVVDGVLVEGHFELVPAPRP